MAVFIFFLSAVEQRNHETSKGEYLVLQELLSAENDAVLRSWPSRRCLMYVAMGEL